MRDEWAAGITARLPYAEKVFHQSPQDWDNDVNFLHLAVLCEYLDREAGISYKEDQKYIKSILYTDPSDLFLNGVMDTLRGTCGNMAALQVAVGWRLGWPVSLACVRSHYICRYDDGRVTYNIEATDTGRGGFSSRSDARYIEEFRLPPRAIRSGSDLRAVTPRELLGLFVGLRARHMKDIGNLAEAERDYLLARHLFPTNRALYFGASWVSVQRSAELFEADEEGYPSSLAAVIEKHYGRWQPLQQLVSCTDVGYSIKI